MRAIAVLYNLILVPGVGQIAIGRWRRALPWLVVLAAAPFAALVHPWAAIAIFLGAKVGSAVEVALLEVRGERPPVQTLAVYGGGLVATLLWFSFMQTFVIEAFKIPSAGMFPTLEIGDHLFVNKLSYQLGEAERGDVVVFANPCEPNKDFVQRLVGLPGDTIEVRCDVLFVNGEPAPASSLKEDCWYWDRKEDGGALGKQPCASYVESLGGRQYEIVHDPVRRERDRLRKVAGGERTYAELSGDGDFPDHDRMPQCPPIDREPPPAVGRIEPSPPPARPDACAPRSHYVVPDGHVFAMGDNRESSSDSRRWGPVPTRNLKGKVISIWWSSRSDDQGGISWGRIGPLD